MTAPFRIETLAPEHDRAAFSCGVEALNQYLLRQVSQDVRRSVSACYVAVEVGTGRIAGYYTLAAGGVPLNELPPTLTKRLPRYPSVPVARIGRLAVDQAFHGRSLGAALLADAALRAARSSLPCSRSSSMRRTMPRLPSTATTVSRNSAARRAS